MKFINKLSKNKVKLLLAIIIILAVILIVSMVLFFKDNTANPGYGNRLDGIEEVKITKEETQKMNSTLEKEKKVKSVTSNIQGKIVNVIVKVEKATKIKEAQELPKKVIDCFKEEQVNYYDFQVFIQNEDTENKSYPIIGYKKATSKGFSFTKNRGDK